MHGKPGFIWTVESYSRDGELLDSETQHNLLPEQGLNHWIGVLLNKSPQVPTWYIGLYSGNYTPVPGDTAATFPVDASEFTAYPGPTRPVFNPGHVVGGECNNYASPVEIVMSADATLYGGFLISSSGKGALSGTLLSAVKFPSPRIRETGETLRIKVGVGLISFN